MKARVFFTPKLRSSPMTSWVHESWPENAVTYPMPGPVSGRGYANHLVRTGGSLFRCSSLEEVLVCIETLARKRLDNPLRKGVFDPTGHWLNKLPRGLERWERRERIVRDLRRALATFERETGLHPMPPNRPGDHVRRRAEYATR
jgi:hypothetical protein